MKICVLYHQIGSGYAPDLDWPGEITIVNGRPIHPQSHGLIEKGSSTVEEMLACKFYSEKQANCTFWLPEIQCESYSDV